MKQEIDPDVLDALVPNLILQPIVENAIKHGISRLETTGRITLRAWREGDQLWLCVRDNGPGLSGNGQWQEGWDCATHGPVWRDSMATLPDGAAAAPGGRRGSLHQFAVSYATDLHVSAHADA